MSMTLTAAHKRDISESLAGTDPASVAEAAVLWALRWQLTAGVDGDDTTEEGARRTLEAQRRISDLTDAIWDGVCDGSVTARRAPDAAEESMDDFTSVFGGWFSDDERVELGIDPPPVVADEADQSGGDPAEEGDEGDDDA